MRFFPSLIHLFLVASVDVSESQSNYKLMNTLDVGTPNVLDPICNHRRTVLISDTKRLAALTCAQKQIEVYEFDATSSSYDETPIFTTNGCSSYNGFGFSQDGKTIICPTSQCTGRVYYEGTDGQWGFTDMTWFDCSKTYYPGYYQIGTSYDGSSFMVGGGALTTVQSDYSKHNHGIVKVYEKSPEGAWTTTFEHQGTFGKGHVGYSGVLSNDGTRLLFNDKDQQDGGMIMRYSEKLPDGTWATPVMVPTPPAVGYAIKGFFTPDADRMVVSTNPGLYILDYDNLGGWTLVKTFSGYTFSGSDGNSIVDLSDDGRRLIFCGAFLGKTFEIYDEQDDGSWSSTAFGSGGTTQSWGGCTLDGSGGIIASTTRDGALKTYRDESVEIITTTDSPSDLPSFQPSISPSPSFSPSSQPSQTLSSSPSSSPSPSSPPSSQPSLTLSAQPSQSAAPSSVIIKDINTQASDYKIGVVQGSIAVDFDNDSSVFNLSFDMKVTQGRSGELKALQVHDYDTCHEETYGSDVVNATMNAATTVGNYDITPANIEIKTSNITSYNTLYMIDNSTDTSHIKFCILAEIGTVTIMRNGTAEETAISYTMMKYDLVIDLAIGFSSAAVSLDEIAADEASNTTQIDGLDKDFTACECDAATQTCYDSPTPQTQNSLVTICLSTNTTGFVIGDVKALTLSQPSGLSLNVISGYNANDFTIKSLMGTQKEVISTRIPRAFFVEPSPVTVEGVAVLTFDQSGRKLMRFGGNHRRALEEDLAETEFTVEVELNPSPSSVTSDGASNSLNMACSIVLAIGAIAIGVGF